MIRNKVAIYTLGCKVNQYESHSLATLFEDEGFQVVDFKGLADVYVVNTCAVTVQAASKSRHIVRQARRQNPDALIVVAGCYVQVDEEEATLEGVDIVVGSNDKRKIIDLVLESLATDKRGKPISLVTEFTKTTAFEELQGAYGTDRIRAELKIQDGCQQFCAYCIIPYARGPERSRTFDSIISEAKKLTAHGFKEIVLTGIHLGSYGRDMAPQGELADIVKELLSKTNIERIRLSSVEPNDISNDLVNIISSSPRVARHLHIPLQSGCDKVLKAMDRKYLVDDYKEVVQNVRTKIPEIAITTDLIVGFPGETDLDYQETREFVEHIGFSKMHIFRYSKRPGTPAAKMPAQVDASTKTARSQDMHQLAQQMSHKFHLSMIGKQYEVLLEKQLEPGWWEGHTDTYIKVQVPGELETNKCYKVIIVAAKPDYVITRLV